MIQTTHIVNNNVSSSTANGTVEIGVVAGYSNNQHSHEYQVFNLDNPLLHIGRIGVSNADVFAIQFKFKSEDDYAFAVYLDGVNVSQKGGIKSLNEIPERQRYNYHAHEGKFVSRYKKTRGIRYINRYSQKNGENRELTFTTLEKAGINEVLLNDAALKNRIEIYVWRDVEGDDDDKISIDYSPDIIDDTKIGAGKATNQEYNNVPGLNNPEFLAKVIFIHTHTNNLSHLGKTLISIEDLVDPMDRVPTT